METFPDDVSTHRFMGKIKVCVKKKKKKETQLKVIIAGTPCGFCRYVVVTSLPVRIIYGITLYVSHNCATSYRLLKVALFWEVN